MNRALGVIVGVITTLFGLWAAPELTPTSSASPALAYAYETHHYTPISVDTAAERGPSLVHDGAAVHSEAAGPSRGV